jgi:hypothetical protein
MSEEIKWFIVKIWLDNGSLEASMTKQELEGLKATKIRGNKYYFETKHELSTRLLIDVTKIVAITETQEYGDD